MTKPLMQGKIGYWVDGELKFMPPKRSPRNDVTKNVTTYRTVKVEPTHVTRNVLCNTYLEQHFVILQDLKNASKIGYLDGVLKVIQTYFFSRYKGLSASDRFSELTRLLFVPDIEGRSAFYYTALTGHSALVEFYMCIYLMRFARISDQSITWTWTFRQWFQFLGMPFLHGWNYFSRADLDICILNSLDTESTRHLISKKKVSIQYSVQFVVQSIASATHRREVSTLFQSKADRILLQIRRMKKFKRKKTIRPALNYGDEDDRLDDLCVHRDWDAQSNSSMFDIDEESSIVEHMSTKEESSKDKDDTDTIHSLPLSCDTICASLMNDNFEWDILSEGNVDVDFEGEMKYHMTASMNEYGFYLEDEGEVSDHEHEDAASAAEWDIVSQVPSIQSFDSLTLSSNTGKSYRDAVLQKVSVRGTLVNSSPDADQHSVKLT
eukprot:scaffold13572_cov56-Attheya_sp.AAC.3